MKSLLTANPLGIDAVDFLDLVFNHKKVDDAFNNYVGSSYRQHNPTQPDGKDASKSSLLGMVSHFPNIEFHPKRVLVDGDLVAVHSHYKTNEADIGMAAVDIFRFLGGRIVEHWDVLQQIPESRKNDNTMF